MNLMVEAPGVEASAVKSVLQGEGGLTPSSDASACASGQVSAAADSRQLRVVRPSGARSQSREVSRRPVRERGDDSRIHPDQGKRLSVAELDALRRLILRCTEVYHAGGGPRISRKSVLETGAFDLNYMGTPIAGHGHVYLVEIKGVCVKVGITNRPEKRIEQHRHAARKMGRTVGRTFMTPVRGDARSIEAAMKSRGSEYLRIPFDKALWQLERLLRTVGDPSPDMPVRKRRARKTVSP